MFAPKKLITQREAALDLEFERAPDQPAAGEGARSGTESVHSRTRKAVGACHRRRSAQQAMNILRQDAPGLRTDAVQPSTWRKKHRIDVSRETFVSGCTWVMSSRLIIEPLARPEPVSASPAPQHKMSSSDPRAKATFYL